VQRKRKKDIKKEKEIKKEKYINVSLGIEPGYIVFLSHKNNV
jgi:hypothetical protein